MRPGNGRYFDAVSISVYLNYTKAPKPQLHPSMYFMCMCLWHAPDQDARSDAILNAARRVTKERLPLVSRRLTKVMIRLRALCVAIHECTKKYIKLRCRAEQVVCRWSRVGVRWYLMC